MLRTYKFTNVYRDLDAVSVDCRREVLDQYRPWKRSRAAALVGDVICYRLFNWPATWARLTSARSPWDEAGAKRILHKAQAAKQQVFTGAYIVTNNGESRPKIDLVCEAVTAGYELAPMLVREIRAECTLRHATAVIQQHVPLCGPFVAYEMVSDLRWTPLLEKAPDIMTWANPGPGAVRGLNRLHGRRLTSKPNTDQLIDEMRELLRESQRPGRLGDHMRPLEMRDVEHSLCELDKLLRARNGEGRPRARYWPPGHPNRAK